MMARGDGKATKGKTKGKAPGVKRMVLGGMTSSGPSGGNKSPSASMGGFGSGGAGGAGGGGNTVNRAAKSDRLSSSQLGPGALREYANQRIDSTFDASGDYRAPQTVNTAAKGNLTPSQVVNTAAKGDLLATQMPSYVQRSRSLPGVASQFRTLEAAGLGPYTGNKKPGSSTRGSFGGFGVNEGPQTDIGDLVAGVKSGPSRGTPVSSSGEFYSSLPSPSKVAGGRPPDMVASYMGNKPQTTGPRRQAGEAAATPKSNTGPSFESFGRGAGAVTETKPSATTTTASDSPPRATGGRQNFTAGPVPGGGGRGNDDRPRKPMKPILERDGGNRYSHGGSIRGDGKSRVRTKGKVC